MKTETVWTSNVGKFFMCSTPACVHSPRSQATNDAFDGALCGDVLEAVVIFFTWSDDPMNKQRVKDLKTEDNRQETNGARLKNTKNTCWCAHLLVVWTCALSGRWGGLPIFLVCLHTIHLVGEENCIGEGNFQDVWTGEKKRKIFSKKIGQK